MSEFTEEIPGQIAGGINRLGDGEYTSYSIYPLPADAAYDETIYPEEWIQTCGVAPDRITVEMRRLDPDGTYRVYTVGHPQAADEATAAEPIYNGDNKYLVRPGEVLTATAAIELFQHYYDHHAVAAGWHLREQPEFTVAAAGGTALDTSAAGLSSGESSAAAAAALREKAQPGAAAAKPAGKRETGAN